MRTDDLLPQGDLVKLIPDVTYNVPGLFQFSSLIFSYIELIEKKFNFHIPIKYIYGAPPVKWNGGRFLLYEGIPSSHIIENELKGCTLRGITPLLTFSNILISKTDLEDILCNRILEILDNLSGGVILSSDILYHYIKKNYPNIKIHASVIKCTNTKNRTSIFYEELSLKFDQYVVHPDDIFKIDLMQKIPLSNADLLVNERCYQNCSMRYAHYISISREQINRSSGTIIDEKFLRSCHAIPEKKQLDSKHRNISLSIKETKQLVNLGFKSLKLQGRTDALPVFFFDLMRYTLESEVAFPAMFPAFYYEIQDFLKRR